LYFLGLPVDYGLYSYLGLLDYYSWIDPIGGFFRGGNVSDSQRLNSSHPHGNVKTQGQFHNIPGQTEHNQRKLGSLSGNMGQAPGLAANLHGQLWNGPGQGYLPGQMGNWPGQSVNNSHGQMKNESGTVQGMPNQNGMFPGNFYGQVGAFPGQFGGFPAPQSHGNFPWPPGNHQQGKFHHPMGNNWFPQQGSIFGDFPLQGPPPYGWHSPINYQQQQREKLAAPQQKSGGILLMMQSQMNNTTAATPLRRKSGKLL
jgi:hypothetical protein